MRKRSDNFLLESPSAASLAGLIPFGQTMLGAYRGAHAGDGNAVLDAATGAGKGLAGSAIGGTLGILGARALAPKIAPLLIKYLRQAGRTGSLEEIRGVMSGTAGLAGSSLLSDQFTRDKEASEKMNKQAQETISIDIPEPVTKAKDILSRFAQGFGMQGDVLGARSKMLKGVDSIGDSLSEGAREGFPRGKALPTGLKGLSGDDTAGQIGQYARHYSPHLLALLAAAAGGYGLKNMLSKEGSDQMDKQAQADFERGFMDKLAEYGMDKRALFEDKEERDPYLLTKTLGLGGLGAGAGGGAGLALAGHKLLETAAQGKGGNPTKLPGAKGKAISALLAALAGGASLGTTGTAAGFAGDIGRGLIHDD